MHTDKGHIAAGDIVVGMTVKVRGLGRKNRTTMLVTTIKPSRTKRNVMDVWGDNPNASYGQRSQVFRYVPADQQVEIVTTDKKG
jgi:hypothetical protein